MAKFDIQDNPRWSPNSRWYVFTCPGCKIDHAFITDREKHPVWTVTGEGDNLTFRPSLLYTTTEHRAPVQCHSFVTNGRIQFLSDCGHELAGQTVDIPDYDE